MLHGGNQGAAVGGRLLELDAELDGGGFPVAGVSRFVEEPLSGSSYRAVRRSWRLLEAFSVALAPFPKSRQAGKQAGANER